MKHPIYLIAAADKNLGIGKSGDLPWRLKDDLLHFQTITTETKDPTKTNIVIMGRKTWESLPEKHRPLSNRKNIVLSRNKEYKIPNIQVCPDIESAINEASSDTESIFIIGGGTIYKKSIEMPEITGIYLTQLEQEFDCDTYFPTIPPTFTNHQPIGEGEEKGITYTYNLYTK